MEERDDKPPTIDEVMKYAREQIEFHKWSVARYENKEHQEEMAQEALLRVWRKHKQMRSVGWKAFCQRLIKGSFVGYLRLGKGFEERKKSLRKVNSGAAFIRLSPHPRDDNEMTPEKVIDLNLGGVGLEEIDFDEINWDLVSRLSRVDHGLHILVRHFFCEEHLASMTDIFGVSRERLGQRLQAFLSGFSSSPAHFSSWRKQVIFALGLCKAFDLPAVDTGEGWALRPINFNEREVVSINWGKRQTAMDIDSCVVDSLNENGSDEIKISESRRIPNLRMSDGSLDDHLQMEFSV